MERISGPLVAMESKVAGFHVHHLFLAPTSFRQTLCWMERSQHKIRLNYTQEQKAKIALLEYRLSFHLHASASSLPYLYTRAGLQMEEVS